MIKSVFYNFWRNLGKVFRGWNLGWHLLAGGLTYIIVVSEFDWWWFVRWNGTAVQTALFSAAIVGGLGPILLPFVLYGLGRFWKVAKLELIAYAVAQAGILGWLISSLYKVFTGRLQPPWGVTNLVDISRSFEFGVYRHGVFWGWPSSHTTVAFAVAVALCVLYPKNRLVQTIAIASALYIGIGVSMNIHWFSDFIAGIIIGSVIGYTVGKSFISRQIKTE